MYALGLREEALPPLVLAEGADELIMDRAPEMLVAASELRVEHFMARPFRAHEDDARWSVRLYFNEVKETHNAFRVLWFSLLDGQRMLPCPVTVERVHYRRHRGRSAESMSNFRVVIRDAVDDPGAVDVDLARRIILHELGPAAQEVLNERMRREESNELFPSDELVTWESPSSGVTHVKALIPTRATAPPPLVVLRRPRGDWLPIAEMHLPAVHDIACAPMHDALSRGVLGFNLSGGIHMPWLEIYGFGFSAEDARAELRARIARLCAILNVCETERGEFLLVNDLLRTLREFVC